MGDILCIGADPGLLHTRQLVLGRSGASVRRAPPEVAEFLLRCGSFDLVVVCHSVASRTVDALCGAARKSNPGVKALLVTQFRSGSFHIEVDAAVAVEDGPHALLQAAIRLLGNRATASLSLHESVREAVQPRMPHSLAAVFGFPDLDVRSGARLTLLSTGGKNITK